MKPKPDWNVIESRIDFGRVNEKLAQFSASGAGRRKTVNDLLDKVKAALLQPRSDGASYRALAAFLTESGMPVSEPMVRQYLRSQGAEKPRKKARTTGKSGAKPCVPGAQPLKAQPVVVPKADAQPVIERLKPRPDSDQWSEGRRRQGPRIAGPSTL